MPDYTNATMRPHVARLLLQSPNHTITAAQARQILMNELIFSPNDLVVDRAQIPHWWHRVLSVVAELRARNILLPDNPAVPRTWSLTFPTGIAWAQEVTVLHAPEMNHDFVQPLGHQRARDAALGAEEGGVPYQSDSRVRKAVEVRALELAEEQYAVEGYTTRRVGSPYDLECERQPSQDRCHVEVKGFQDENPTSAILTSGEVKHVRQRGIPVDLVIAVGISVLNESGELRGRGGRIGRHIRNWQPLEEDLHPTHFKYTLPREN